MAAILPFLTSRIGLALLCAALAGAGGTFKGYQWGKSTANAKHQRAVDALNAKLDAAGAKVLSQEVKRLHAERERDELQDTLDTEAAQSPNALRPAVDVGGVRRLNRL